MTKEDLEILPPAISLMIKDVMHRCRECPPSNWPMHAYELVDRQDLAALDKHLKSSSRLQYIDGETKDYGIKDEQDDGMEFDDMVYIYACFLTLYFFFYTCFTKCYHIIFFVISNFDHMSFFLFIQNASHI